MLDYEGIKICCGDNRKLYYIEQILEIAILPILILQSHSLQMSCCGAKGIQ
jgi:hypothetical protein